MIKKLLVSIVFLNSLVQASAQDNTTESASTYESALQQYLPVDIGKIIKSYLGLPKLTGFLNLSNKKILETYVASQFRTVKHLKAAKTITDKIYETKLRECDDLSASF